MSGLIWVQTERKGYQQTALGGKELKIMICSVAEVPKSPEVQLPSKEETQMSMQSEQESEAAPGMEEPEGTFTSIADTETTDGE